MYRSILCLLLCSAVLVQGVINDCGSKVGSYTNISITNCKPEASTCILKRGKVVTISITFNVDRDIKEVNAEVHGIIAGAALPFPFSQKDACSKSGLSCPLKKDNGPYTYSATLNILPIYPPLKVIVKWELKDENGDDIVCALIPSEIKL
ncbi:NPC intracellular cholesterol transporter 2 homolog a-like [Chelonus insularis]|uniref:NPC intracellular cholesterol transporter 2 homolog a-like n=1 Tax=Chelonus insularis TaxID=460826 RepID=UPI00158BEC24|nr:NPC intracellular cholesterol transporter 2 homolog a-like [Chelonus insularis]